MKRNYFILISAIIIIIILTLFIFQKPNQPLKIVGGELPPFEYSENGGLKGIHIEYVKKILSNLNRNHEIELLNWNDAIESVKRGDADLMLSTTYTKERSRYIDYPLDFDSKIIPETSIWTERYVFFYKNNSNLNLSTEKSIRNNNYRVALVKGYGYSDILYNQNLNFFIYNSEKEAISAVHSKEMDLVVLNLISGLQIIKGEGLEGQIFPHDKIIFTTPNFIVFSKSINNDKFRGKFYEELVRLKKEENLHNILYKKYIGKTFDELYKKLLS